MHPCRHRPAPRVVRQPRRPKMKRSPPRGLFTSARPESGAVNSQLRGSARFPLLPAATVPRPWRAQFPRSQASFRVRPTATRKLSEGGTCRALASRIHFVIPAAAEPESHSGQPGLHHPVPLGRAPDNQEVGSREENGRSLIRRDKPHASARLELVSDGLGEFPGVPEAGCVNDDAFHGIVHLSPQLVPIASGSSRPFVILLQGRPTRRLESASRLDIERAHARSFPLSPGSDGPFGPFLQATARTPLSGWL